MSGVHARPKNPFARPAHATAAASPHAGRGRRAGFGTRLRRRIRAHRDIDILSSYIPGDEGGAGAGKCLLLVRVRKVVGQIHYRVCTTCGEGVITTVDIEELYHFSRPRLHTRALSHLRFRHPDVTWQNMTSEHSTRSLLYRLSHSAPAPSSRCVHTAR
ncbi:hypothetical protein ACFWCB_11125 [Streptomyces sp. NPDC060048]|uniref:hypothetical protein n=1 Tax=unclassified Streptomyces TaxID=2593676 RepID=UPI0036BF32B2